MSYLCLNSRSSLAIRVRLGEWDAAQNREPIAPQEFTIQRIFIHPSFVASNLRNDVAILRLSSPVILGQTPTITTGCLPANVFPAAQR
jgi:hypothetical protein